MTDSTREREARKGLAVQRVSGPTPETILGEMGVSLPQHPTMSCDGNGAFEDRNRHCDKCDPAEIQTVESLTAYYKQFYDEGEYSVGDLCVMLARAEVGCSALESECSALESDLARVTRERDELVRQFIILEARIERDRHRVQEVRELRAALAEVNGKL